MFRKPPIAEIVEAKVFEYRDKGFYVVHRYVVMPDHLHIILTPGMTTLEKAVGLFKGGASFDIGKAVAMKFPVWHEGFAEHQIDDQDDYEAPVRYIDLNPVKAGLVREPSEYSHCSLNGKYRLDSWPVASGAKQAVEKLVFVEIAEKGSRQDAPGTIREVRGMVFYPPICTISTLVSSFSAACKAPSSAVGGAAGLKPRPTSDAWMEKTAARSAEGRAFRPAGKVRE